MELAQKALAMDDSFSTTHGLLSSIFSQKGEHDKAIAEGERAVALDPNGADAYSQYANCFSSASRWQKAIPLYQKAIRLNPIGAPFASMNLGMAYGFIGQVEEAVSVLKEALLRSPDNILARLGLASFYTAMGREKEAQAEAAEVLRINPNFSLDNLAKAIPSKDQSVTDRYIGYLRKAGLK